MSQCNFIYKTKALFADPHSRVLFSTAYYRILVMALPFSTHEKRKTMEESALDVILKVGSGTYHLALASDAMAVAFT